MERAEAIEEVLSQTTGLAAIEEDADDESNIDLSFGVLIYFSAFRALRGA